MINIFMLEVFLRLKIRKKGTSILLLGALKPLISNVTKFYAYPDNVFTPREGVIIDHNVIGIMPLVRF